jgi:protein AaeX
MNLSEINLFGVYVAPISVIMVAAWFLTLALQRTAVRFGLLRYVWHAALFAFSVYLILLSTIVLLIAR